MRTVWKGQRQMDYLNNKVTILNDIKTITERDLILSEISAIKRKDFGSVRKSFLDRIGGIDLNEFSKEIKNLEVARIFLALEPTIGILDIINDFFQENLKKKVLFDFEINSEMLGGLQIVYKGNYFDSSIL